MRRSKELIEVLKVVGVGSLLGIVLSTSFFAYGDYREANSYVAPVITTLPATLVGEEEATLWLEINFETYERSYSECFISRMRLLQFRFLQPYRQASITYFFE